MIEFATAGGVRKVVVYIFPDVGHEEMIGAGGGGY